MYAPKANVREFDEERHLDLALSPWAFQCLPGTRAALWPAGLPELVERLESMPRLALWAEPLDTLGYGLEFLDASRSFMRAQIRALADLHAEGNQAS